MTEERWREIPGFPAYRVSDTGRVQSRWKRLFRRGMQGASGMSLGDKWKDLKITTDKRGRRTVELTEGGAGKTIRATVHRLVLLSFIGPCPDGMEGCHNDGNPSNNKLDNLRWDTHENNEKDKVRHGTLLIGEDNPASTLTLVQVKEIKQLLVDGWTTMRIAQKYGVSDPGISMISTGRNWGHVPFPEKSAAAVAKWNLNMIPLPTFGGKYVMAKRYHEIAAPYKHTVFPGGWKHRVSEFAGGIGELWRWEHEDVSEVISDIDHRYATFYKVLRDPALFARFYRTVSVCPVSEQLWKEAKEFFDKHKKTDKVDECMMAFYFFVLVRQSMGKRQKTFAPLTKTRLRNGINPEVSAWLSAIDGLEEAHKRLQNVVVLDRPAIEVIRTQDGPQTLHFCDPTYLHETRTAKKVYTHEMSNDDHVELLDALLLCKGFVMLCGYQNELYTDKLRGWDVHTFDVACHSSTDAKKGRRQEVCWTNFTLRGNR